VLVGAFQPAGLGLLQRLLGQVHRTRDVPGLDVHRHERRCGDGERQPGLVLSGPVQKRLECCYRPVELPRLLERFREHESRVRGGGAVEPGRRELLEGTQGLGRVPVGQRQSREVDLGAMEMVRDGAFVLEQLVDLYAQPGGDPLGGTRRRGALA